MFFFVAGPAMPDRQAFNGDCNAFRNGENAFRRLFQRFVGLHDGDIRSQASDGDVFVDEDARFGVDGVGDLDDGSAGDIGAVNGGLERGEVASAGAYRMVGWRRCVYRQWCRSGCGCC